MQATVRKNPFFFLVTVAVSCLLVCSFGLHLVQIEHTHPGENTHTSDHGASEINVLGEYLHGTEKKLFIFTILGFLFFGAFVLAHAALQPAILLTLSTHFFRAVQRKRLKHSRANSYLQLLFSNGILHTKAY